MKDRAILRHHADRLVTKRLNILLGQRWGSRPEDFAPGYLTHRLSKNNLTCSCRTCRAASRTKKYRRPRQNWMDAA